ncbi:histidinol-phosphate aminotransferase family protein [Candidatus Sumerlaeota bacterium]|nr:histidinol-phosphate aminotransferase family protein [Candidatus Sumerlaeota bacterium]
MTTIAEAKIKPAPGIDGVKAYSVPKHPAPIDLKLDANEGGAPDAALLKRIQEIGPDVMRRYPDASAVQRLLAMRNGVEPANLIVTAGADDALDRLCRAVLAPGRELLLTNPSFEMLPRYARIAGASIREVKWWSGAFPTDEMLREIKPNTALIAMVSPNNPTGTVAIREDFARLAEAAPQAVILLDHAYVEFADEDMTSFALQFPNAIVARTLSKAWGLAGLRVGYAVSANEDLISWMRASGGPYAVARPSIALAAARIEADHGAMEKFVKQVRADRRALGGVLDELGVRHSASEANFVFITDSRALWIRDALASLGISIRAYSGDPVLGESLRITCPGDEIQCQRLVRALRTALKPSTQGADEWIVCHTLDEVRSARANGDVAIALVADRGKTDEFLRAGAARVVTDIKEMETFLQ